MRYLAKTSISVQLAQRLVRQRQTNTDRHICEKYTEEAR